jgi:DNA mismatch repair protein MLH1
LTSKAELLREYYAVDISSEGMLCGLPVLLDEYCPDLAGLPRFLFRLAVEVDWESETDCLSGIARELGALYQDPGDASGPAAQEADDTPAAAAAVEAKGRKWMIEHCVFPGLRGMFAPPSLLQRNGSIVEIADLHQLYKIFERC